MGGIGGETDFLVFGAEGAVLVEEGRDVGFAEDFEGGYALDGHGGDEGLCVMMPASVLLMSFAGS